MVDASPDLSMAERIDSVCDQFERDFRAGRDPTLEAFLAESPELTRPAMLRALLELELELRQKAGETPQAADYEARFPAAADTIREVFEAQKRAPTMMSSLKITGIDTSHKPLSKTRAVSSPGQAAPLTQLGRFEIKSVLGEGAFGTVYRARDPQLDRDVAVKVPRFAGQQSREDRERFLREARAAAGLQHAHICPVHEVGIVGDRDYIVLAFIDGKPLSKILQTQPKLSDRQIIAVIRKLALALQEAHDQGIIHRDLKPGNIMINRKGEPVIMDFGLARRTHSGDAQISHSGQIMGTPAYMSPEQARGDGKSVGPQADVYSLGVVLYEMICGRRPFDGSVTEVIGKILHVDPPPPSQFRPDVDERLQAICLKAMAKNPADRFASMKEFAAALIDYARALPTGKRPGATPAIETGKEPATNQFADLLAAISSDVESKVERAVRRVDRPGRLPWWSYIIGSAVMGLIVLFGVLFFIRKDTVTVIVNIPIENIHDPALKFFLNGKSIAAEAFASPIELKPGEHELIVNKDGKLFKQFRFSVGKANHEPVTVTDVTAESATPPPPVAASPAIAPFDAEQARQYQEAWARHLAVPVEYTNSMGMKFRLIPPGEYLRGSPPEEIKEAIARTPNDEGWKIVFNSEGPQHRVALTQPFYLATYETTQADYQAISGANPAHFSSSGAGRKLVDGLATPSFPVEMVSWFDAIDFCAKLSERENLRPHQVRSTGQVTDHKDGTGYRLPTEAEWEFACRAGTTTLYSSGNRVDDLLTTGWFARNAGDRTHPVGKLSPNAFGLCDLHGNVQEWCLDGSTNNAYLAFNEQRVENPRFPHKSSQTVIYRGGTYFENAPQCRAAVRNNNFPDFRGQSIGFRAALSVEGVKQSLQHRAFNGHAYRFFPEQVTWKTAKARCEALGGHLVIVETPEENAFLAQLITDGGKVDSWIGATDEGSEGKWRWVNGQPLTWSNWFTLPKQPNNKAGVEHFAVMSNRKLARDGFIGWEWSDQPNESLQAHEPGYVCEWDAMPVDTISKVDDPDRKAAEFLLSLSGGFVKVNGQDRQIRQVSGLPTGPFRLTGAYFAEVKSLDDNGLAVLKDCVHLTELDLRSTRVTEKGLEIFRGKTNFTSLGLAYLRVTDTGLEIFKDNKGLKMLFLHDTYMTDKGLSLFHDCKELGTIWVGGTPITDAGMLPFRECKFLKWLDVRATKVTREGVQTMKATRPACRVDSNPDKR